MEIPVNNANAIAALAFERGFLVGAPRDNVLRFMPALNLSRAEIDQAVALLHSIFARMRFV